MNLKNAQEYLESASPDFLMILARIDDLVGDAKENSGLSDTEMATVLYQYFANQEPHNNAIQDELLPVGASDHIFGSLSPEESNYLLDGPQSS